MTCLPFSFDWYSSNNDMIRRIMSWIGSSPNSCVIEMRRTSFWRASGSNIPCRRHRGRSARSCEPAPHRRVRASTCPPRSSAGTPGGDRSWPCCWLHEDFDKLIAARRAIRLALLALVRGSTRHARPAGRSKRAGRGQPAGRRWEIVRSFAGSFRLAPLDQGQDQLYAVVHHLGDQPETLALLHADQAETLHFLEGA